MILYIMYDIIFDIIYDMIYDIDVLRLERGERHNIPESWMLINSISMFWFGIFAIRVTLSKYSKHQSFVLKCAGLPERHCVDIMIVWIQMARFNPCPSSCHVWSGCKSLIPTHGKHSPCHHGANVRLAQLLRPPTSVIYCTQHFDVCVLNVYF